MTLNPEKGHYQISLKAILRDADGRVLGLGGRADGAYVGRFDLPGGRIDEGEFRAPFIDILKREVAEELGDVRVDLRPFPVAAGNHAFLSKRFGPTKVLYLAFEGRFLGGDIRVSDEHVGFRWFTLDDACREEFFISGNREVLCQYRDQLAEGA